MQSLQAALKFLTVFPYPKASARSPWEISSAILFFPLVGFFVGVLLVVFNYIFDPYLASEILSVLLVAVLVMATGARHLSGLANTVDRLASEIEGRKTHAASGESLAGIFGVATVVLMIAFKIRAIEVMGEARNQGVLLAPVLGYWAMAILMYGSARPDKEIQPTAERVRGKHLFLSTLIALSLVATLAGKLGLRIALSISLFAVLARAYFERRLGGVNNYTLGAVSELAETFALILFATF
ncbi:MAG: adenosylcobinamide-GDP ribazoletransferase [Deltaproteobacteria bacterium]|nr:adenosylcobinamide-GDP ribazoletransferase [Deltaproteobacteria bacterium]